MLPALKIEVDGLQELKAKFDLLGGEQQTQIQATAFEHGAKIYQADAKAFCPKATGFLAAQIQTKTTINKTKGQVTTKVQVGAGWYISDAFYGSFQEFGWHPGKRLTKAEQNIRQGMGQKRDSRGFRDGQHYMRHSAEKNAGTVPEMIAQEIAQSIERLSTQ